MSHFERCGLAIDRGPRAAKNLAALTEIASVYLMEQLINGQLVDWFNLLIRPTVSKLGKCTRRLASSV